VFFAAATETSPHPLTRPIVAAAVLAILWIAEGSLPMFLGRTRRAGHAARHLALAAINAGVLALFFAGATLAVSEWAAARGFGVLRVVALPAWAHWLLALVLIDLWQYFWHRLNHRVPILWRFHSVHHSDAELDASSGVRFHTGEIVLSGLARLAVLPALGATIEHVALYELIVTPIVLFHHSNIRVPQPLDRVLRLIIVTPWMHWVHHSRWQPETDSNYSSGLSVWDRVFGTFRLRDDPRAIRLGLDGYDGERSGTLTGMLVSPVRKAPASNPALGAREPMTDDGSK
jgi:sterol desaturase/sphingolipid hydroxylase (fatty acid hydroxylase superfamily)